MKKLEENNLFERRVAHYAITLQRLTGKPRCTLIEKAETLTRLVQGMKTTTVSFIFIGQDERIHKVEGTLMNYANDFKRAYHPNSSNRFMPYFDTKINAWRTFQISGIVLIES